MSSKVIDYPGIYRSLIDAAQPPEAPWRPYLNKIGINDQVIEALNLRVCSKDYPKVIDEVRKQYDDEDLVAADVIFDPLFEEDDQVRGTFHNYHQAGLDCLLIPYLRNNRPVFIRARPLCNRKQLKAAGVPSSIGTGSSPCPFNIDCIEEAMPVVICRGEIPAMVGISQGVRVMGISRWARFQQVWVHWFREANEVRLLIDAADEDTKKGLPRVQNMFDKAGMGQPSHGEMKGDLKEFFTGLREEFAARGESPATIASLDEPEKKPDASDESGAPATDQSANPGDADSADEDAAS
ncbi:MAG: hypothetical protein R3336_05150 [Phycisphaeraceae bacterium]|nr:hypothetical protein [Phycisphaeraceae bacterium]